MAKRKAPARPTPTPAGPKRRTLAASRPAPAPTITEEPPRKRRTAPPRERVTGAEARATRPAEVPRHSGDRRPSDADVAAAQAVLDRAKRTAPPRVKVQAKKMGFYDHKRRRKGDVFSLKDPKHFTRKWMLRVDQSIPEKITSGREELKRQHDEILGARMEGRTEATASQEVLEEEVDNPLED